jgi:CheY-like chemotaxis protein
VISDVLDLSKIEAGKLVIEGVGFSLHALLESLRRVYGTLADARGLAFTLEIGAGVPDWVWGDPVRVRQVLGNYLNNALKFTAEGALALRARPAGGDLLRFEVQDTGPGIDPAVRAQLFKPFTQADQSTTRRFGGSGLGLSICLELATLMRGRVGVDSEPGRGSCFWAELPLPPSDERAPESGFGALDAPDLCGTRVLMVEDNAVNMTIAVAMLEQWGVAVEQASDGELAIAAVEQAARDGRPFDLVLMDVQMPVMSGYEATRRLRALPAGRGLPIIALTAAALTSEREQALASGMDGFLTKPIDAQRLHDTIAEALGKTR